MFRKLMILVCFSALFTDVQAQGESTAYVRDIIYIIMRETPEQGSEVVRSGLTSGTQLTVLEEEGSYSRVRTSDGAIGWVFTEYLVTRPTARLQLREVQAELDVVTAERDMLEESLSYLRDLTGTPEGEELDMSVLQTELNNLRAQASRVQQAANEKKALEEEVNQLQLAIDSRADEMAGLRAEARNKDVLYGAVAVILGALLAVLLPALRPKKKNDWA